VVVVVVEVQLKEQVELVVEVPQLEVELALPVVQTQVVDQALDLEVAMVALVLSS
jgi:hypothetical protein